MPGAIRETDPALASQAVFRAVMDAMARPGAPRPLPTAIVPPAPLTPATAAIVRTLVDHETPVWLDSPLAAAAAVTQWLRFETGAPIVADPGRAAFALIADPAHLPPFTQFSAGTDAYPDRSTTLILQVDRFDDGDVLVLSGPGLAQPRRFTATPLPADFTRRLDDNRALFPRGIDLVLATANEVAALPRSVRLISRSD